MTFTDRIEFDPAAGDLDAFLRQVPAKWVVYLMADAVGQPIQLLCVKNLRSSLKRRLGGDEPIGPSKRVNYREIVRRISWRRVDSAFEADWIYYEAARELFPQTYQGMVGFRPAWFVHVDPEAAFPRYVKTTDLSKPSGVLIGPLEDKHAAARFIQLAEDAFDLCRYYNILLEAPRASACAYKEMGKCPAPCDGSVSMEQYRRLVELSASAMIDPADYLRDQQRRMQAAAGELKFEIAGKIKAYIDQLSQLGKGAFRHARRLQDFAYLSLQRGPRDGIAKVFLISPGEIEHLVDLLEPPVHCGDVLRVVFARSSERAGRSIDATGAERIGVVAHHLFSPKQTHGVFLPLEAVDERSLAKAYRDLQKQKPQEESDSEGVVKELQAL